MENDIDVVSHELDDMKTEEEKVEKVSINGVNGHSIFHIYYELYYKML